MKTKHVLIVAGAIGHVVVSSLTNGYVYHRTDRCDYQIAGGKDASCAFIAGQFWMIYWPQHLGMLAMKPRPVLLPLPPSWAGENYLRQRLGPPPRNEEGAR